jgi:hypothetical protein
MPRDPAKDWTIPSVEFSSVTSDAGIFSCVFSQGRRSMARPLQSSTTIILTPGCSNSLSVCVFFRLLDSLRACDWISDGGQEACYEGSLEEGCRRRNFIAGQELIQAFNSSKGGQQGKGCERGCNCEEDGEEGKLASGRFIPSARVFFAKLAHCSMYGSIGGRREEEKDLVQKDQNCEGSERDETEGMMLVLSSILELSREADCRLMLLSIDVFCCGPSSRQSKRCADGFGRVAFFHLSWSHLENFLCCSTP